MNHIRYFLMSLIVMMSFTSCIERKSAPVQVRAAVQDDSLKQVISDRDEQINDMMATINKIQEGFNEISEAENRVNIIQDGERDDKAQQIEENIKLIADRMQQNRELIKKLQGQLRDSDFKSAELRRVITNMLTQLDVKDQQLQQLRAELEAKDIHIAELDKTTCDRITYNDLCRGCTHSCKQSFRAVIILCPHYYSKRRKKEDRDNGR